MELEIVEVGPLAASSVAGAAEAGTIGPPVAQQFDSKELPQTLVSEVRPFLRVANQIEAESPRVAFLCRYHAFEKAHMMDPRSTGRGVRQFKIALLLRLEQDDKSTLSKRKEKNDGREIKSFYEKKKQVNAHELMPVLAEVLKALLIGTDGASGRFADRGADETPLAPVRKTSGPDSSCLAEIWRTAMGSCGGWRRLTRSKRNKAGGIPISLIRGTAMETAVRGEATRLRRTPDPVVATTGWSVAAAVQDNGGGIER